MLFAVIAKSEDTMPKCKSKAKDASDDVLVGSAAGALASSSLQVRDDKCFSDFLCSVGVENSFPSLLRIWVPSLSRLS